MRVIHLTFYKCASQWVRDILTDPEISGVSGFPLLAGGIDVISEGWPDVPANSFAGPLYGASYENWLANAVEDDRAIVVLRDPRDLVISLVFSLGFSHVPSSMTRLLRSPISAASDADRVRIGIFLLTQWADRMRSWGTAPPGDREYVTNYRRLTGNPKEEFAAIFRFLGWKIEPRLLHRVVDRHAFEKRTGRHPGDVNPFSHLRKGIDGDWRNYFDRELGEDFEATFPQLLADLGCETDSDWYKALPEKLLADASRIPAGDARVQELLNQLAALEDQYTELGLWRTAAEERLEQINDLTATVNALEERVAAPNLQTQRHLSQIDELTGTVRHLETVSAERLASNQRLNIIIQELVARIAQRNAVAEQRLEQIYELTRMVNELEFRLAAPNELTQERLAQIQTLTEHVHYHEKASEERLLKLHRVTEMVDDLQARIAEPNLAAEERLTQIRELTIHIRHQETVAANRLADIERINAVIESQKERVKELENVSAERLEQIHILTRNVTQLQDRVGQPDPVAEARLADILKLTAHIQSVEQALAEVNQAAEDRMKIIEEIRASASYRYGFLPLSKLGGVLR